MRCADPRRAALTIDPAPTLAASSNPSIAFFARRDLLGSATEPPSTLWDLRAARRILARQADDGSWRYPAARTHVRRQEDYDQIETFRQLGMLVEKLAFTREHPAVARAASFLFARQADDGDFRGIYGNQNATTYVGAIVELLVKAGHEHDPRIARAFAWLERVRQDDGGWAIPLRTVGIPFREFTDARRHPAPVAPDTARPASHLVTGMVLRAYAAGAARCHSPVARRAAGLLASRLYTRDPYGDRGAVAYWERVSFPFWFTDIVSALDSLSQLGVPADDRHVARAVDRLARLQRPDGTFALKIVRGADPDLPSWVCLAVCRALRRWGLA